jgi:hypothetical protein
MPPLSLNFLPTWETVAGLKLGWDLIQPRFERSQSRHDIGRQVLWGPRHIPMYTSHAGLTPKPHPQKQEL